MSRKCPSCGGTAWEPFYESRSGRLLTGDQRIAPGHLAKIVCASCGVVANARALSDDELRELYGEAYQLNTYGREEHLFYTADGPVPRSKVIFDWLATLLPGDATTIVEIGCGEGNVLRRFQEAGPDLQVVGFEGSQHAAGLARAKGLDVRNDLILSSDQSLPTADFLFSYNVLEHVEDLDAFLSVLKRACRPGGRIIFGLPIQDEGGYDLFFAEHVWHFSIGHVARVLRRHGLSIEEVKSHHPVNRGAALFACRVAESVAEPENGSEFAGWRKMQFANRDYWLGIFARVDDLLTQASGHSLAVYGSAEVLSLLMCHTALGEANIVMCLDEDPNKIGTIKHGIPVHHPDVLKGSPVDAVLLTVNARYNDQIRAKLAPAGIAVLSCFSETGTQAGLPPTVE
ncbi:C-methyltransferase-like protein [Bosea sp. BK604]|nr:C-methyltransferase-like protein [Bosea sp. BK604]